jgi:hypothetical protein
MTSLPFFLASSPTTAAWRKATPGSKLEATVIDDGIPVALPCRTPTGPSVK